MASALPNPVVAANAAIAPAHDDDAPDGDEEDPESEIGAESAGIADAPETLSRSETPEATEPMAFDLLPARWPALVQRYAAQKPLTASPLYRSSLCLRAGEIPELEIAFADAPQRDLFLADGENRRALQVFLSGEIGSNRAFTLAFAVDPEAAKNPDAAAAPEGADAWLRREPVLQALIELFEGRLLNLF